MCALTTSSRRLSLVLLLGIGLSFTLAGCNKETEKPAEQTEQAPTKIVAEEQLPTPPEAPPPAPPINETFDGEPQLSLFPRIGGTRPADDDKEQLGYWKTFVEHLRRTAGIARGAGSDGSNCWSFRGNEGVSSLGFFSPLAVTPGASYRVSFDFSAELPEAGEAGIGILQFKEFLWIGDQFTEVQLRDNFLNAQVGVRLKGKQQWANHSFDFTATPQTGMIHLILFREGEQAREPVFFDNIRIEPLTTTQTTEQ